MKPSKFQGRLWWDGGRNRDMVDVSDVVFVEDNDTLLSDVLSGKHKRRKMDGKPSAIYSKKREKGDYTAALKGSKVLDCQQQVSQGSAKPSTVGNEVLTGGAADGCGSDNDSRPCFKCGKLGHWARECDALGRGGGGAQRDSSDPYVVEKPCPCGLGTCLVLTANTEKNRGRKFYKCPVREENGGCRFFQWCDDSLKTPVSNEAQIKPTKSSFPDLQCPCGAGRCSILTAKTEKHMGQQFYRCPSNLGCGFFKWCSEHAPAGSLPISPSQVYSSSNDTSSISHCGRSSSSCFRCGLEGHWARDCPKPSSDYSTQVGARSGSSGTCYKCDKPGHWARDCPG